jgi:alpha-L-fucosidase
MGTIFHYTMYTFVSQPNSITTHADCGQVFNSDLKEMPHPDTFNPSNETFVDQWMMANKAFGAKYAILVAKHCDGFINFRTNATFSNGDAYGYGVQQSSWRNGTGDLVLDFVTSARKHGISPGLYYSLNANFYLAINGTSQQMPVTTKGQRPATREEYFDIVYHHVEELWGNYGDLGEIWFDGGAPYVHNETTRKRIAEIATRLQPHAILLQGPDLVNGARKGNEGESAQVGDPNWYTCQNSTFCRRKASPAIAGKGVFMPAEGAGCAVGAGTSRQWFWHPDHDMHAALKPVGLFVDEYHRSVGLGSNQLMGFTADRRGYVPDNDVAKVTRVGNFISSCYGKPVAVAPESSGAALVLKGPDDYIDLTVPAGQSIDRVWLRENIITGQRALEFRIFVQLLSSAGGDEPFVLVGAGTSVARKRILLLPSAMKVTTVRFQVTKALEWPVPINQAAAFAVCAAP